MDRPDECTASELKKVGVTLLNAHNLVIDRDDCRQQCSPLIGPGGGSPGGYWKCAGCNHGLASRKALR